MNGVFCQELAELTSSRNKVSVVFVHYQSNVRKSEIIFRRKESFDEYELRIPRKKGLFAFFYHQLQVRKLLNELLKQCENVDLLHAQVGWKAAWDAAFFIKNKNIPLLITEHNTDWLPQDRQYPFWKRKLTTWAMKNADVLTAVSANLAEAISAATQKQVGIVPNPVTALFSTAEIKQPSNRGPVFLHVSNFNNRQKQTDKIIKEFSRYVMENPNARLRLNVPENAFHQFKSDNPQCRWENIELLLPDTDKSVLRDRMQNADFLLSYSLYETFGLVIAEALCLGVPAIYTSCKGADLCIDEKMGIVCDAEDNASLLEAMRKSERFLADRNYIAAKARQQFHAEAVLDAYEALYQTLIK